MHVTPQLRAAMRNLLDDAGNIVGLVLRFDNDDASIRTFWSESYMETPGLDPASLRRLAVERIDIKPRSVQLVSESLVNNTHHINARIVQARSPSSAPAVMGGHAEEIMIRSWPLAEKEYGRTPKTVDIVLTHSPCLDQSGAFRMNGSEWPLGCGPKLYRLATDRAYVAQWRIAYFKYYGNSEEIARQAIAKLEKHPRISTYFFHTVP